MGPFSGRGLTFLPLKDGKLGAAQMRPKALRSKNKRSLRKQTFRLNLRMAQATHASNDSTLRARGLHLQGNWMPVLPWPRYLLWAIKVERTSCQPQVYDCISPKPAVNSIR
jgi:hypothetical protein